MPDLRVLKSSLFEQEARQLLEPGLRERVVAGLEWTLSRRAEFGARVRGTSLQVWPVFPGDGHAYIAYYQIFGDLITLHSLVKRRLPVAPQFFDLED